MGGFGLGTTQRPHASRRTAEASEPAWSPRPLAPGQRGSAGAMWPGQRAASSAPPLTLSGAEAPPAVPPSRPAVHCSHGPAMRAPWPSLAVPAGIVALVLVLVACGWVWPLVLTPVADGGTRSYSPQASGQG